MSDEFERRKPQSASAKAGQGTDARDDGEEESLEDLKARARELMIPDSDRMDRDEILYHILKRQGGDGGLSI